MTERVRLQLPRPLPHQKPILDDPCDRKVWRAGRRTGKSVAGRIAGIRGHGPKGEDGRRALRGMLDGANIAWVTKTYKQSKVVWRKLLKAFRLVEGHAVTIDREDRRIEMIGGPGALTVWSGHTRDAIDNLRGDQYDGVLLDEAAYIDAEYAIDEVIEPALLDHGGWVFVFSSPNAGWDKNDQRVTPSYFNRLCQAILNGTEKLWSHFHNRTEDNPRVDAAKLRELRERLGPESPTAQQELDALLVAGGLLAFRLERAAVEVDPFVVPEHWQWFAAFDWGYNHPWVFDLGVTDEDGTVYLVDRATGRQQVPSEITERVRGTLRRYGLTFKGLRYTAAGHDCWQDHKARGERTPTIAEQCARLGWVLTKANIARVSGANNIREYLSAGRFRVFRREGPLAALAVLESRINDPDNPEDVLKTDADHDGRGGDDDYDATRYLLASRPIRARATPPAGRRSPDQAGPLVEVVKRQTKARPAPASRPTSTRPTKGLSFRPGLVVR